MPRLIKLTSCIIAALLAACPIAPSSAAAAPPSLTLTAQAVVQRLADSHTSYEFGNPVAEPRYSPLSRLEFPLDSWWGGARLALAAPRWSASIRGLTNISGEADGKMKDTDWEEPNVVTVYSESECRLNRSWMVTADADLDVSPWLGLPAGLQLRPVIGARFQEFRFTTHDGAQWAYMQDETVNTQPLPGDGINFRQRFWHYFLGLRAVLAAERPGPLHRLGLTVQADYAYVDGFNRDHHLLRSGYRLTEETTRGHAWHGSLGLEAWLTENWSLGVEAEYTYVRTTGSHRLLNEPLGIDYTFDTGVLVWSEQLAASLTLAYHF